MQTADRATANRDARAEATRFRYEVRDAIMKCPSLKCREKSTLYLLFGGLDDDDTAAGVWVTQMSNAYLEKYKAGSVKTVEASLSTLERQGWIVRHLTPARFIDLGPAVSKIAPFLSQLREERAKRAMRRCRSAGYDAQLRMPLPTLVGGTDVDRRHASNMRGRVPENADHILPTTPERENLTSTRRAVTREAAGGVGVVSVGLFKHRTANEAASRLIAADPEFAARVYRCAVKAPTIKFPPGWYVMIAEHYLNDHQATAELILQSHEAAIAEAERLAAERERDASRRAMPAPDVDYGERVQCPKHRAFIQAAQERFGPSIAAVLSRGEHREMNGRHALVFSDPTDAARAGQLGPLGALAEDCFGAKMHFIDVGYADLVLSRASG